MFTAWLDTSGLRPSVQEEYAMSAAVDLMRGAIEPGGGPVKSLDVV